MLAAPRLAPPIHALRSTDPGPLGMLRLIRGNALEMWGRHAYERPALVGSFLGRLQVLLNDPDAIGHVLVRNAANYRRPASPAACWRRWWATGCCSARARPGGTSAAPSRRCWRRARCRC